MSSIPPILRELPEQILGERVLLRPFCAGDGAAIWEATEESRASISLWMPWVQHNHSSDDSEEYARNAHARWITREALPMGVWDKNTGRFLGQCLLVRPNWDIPSFEVGYWLRDSAVGHGYITESVKLLYALAFELLGAQHVHIHCDALNERSANVARRLGFVHEATLRNDDRDSAGKLSDTFIFALTPGDYAGVKVTWGSIEEESK